MSVAAAINTKNRNKKLYIGAEEVRLSSLRRDFGVSDGNEEIFVKVFGSKKSAGLDLDLGVACSEAQLIIPALEYRFNSVTGTGPHDLDVKKQLKSLITKYRPQVERACAVKPTTELNIARKEGAAGAARLAELEKKMAADAAAAAAAATAAAAAAATTASEAARLQGQLTTTQTSVAQLQGQLSEKEANVNRLTLELAAAKAAGDASAADLERQLQTARGEVASTKAELEASRARAADLQRQLEAAQEKEQGLQREKEDALAKATLLETKINDSVTFPLRADRIDELLTKFAMLLVSTTIDPSLSGDDLKTAKKIIHTVNSIGDVVDINEIINQYKLYLQNNKTVEGSPLLLRLLGDQEYCNELLMKKITEILGTLGEDLKGNIRAESSPHEIISIIVQTLLQKYTEAKKAADDGAKLIESIKAELEGVRAELTAAGEALAKCRSESAGKDGTSAEKDAKIRAFEEQIKVITEQQQELSKRAAESEKTQKASAAELAKASETIQRLEAAAAAAAAELSKSKEEVVAAAAELAQTKEQAAAATASLEQVKAELAAANVKVQEKEAALQAAEAAHKQALQDAEIKIRSEEKASCDQRIAELGSSKEGEIARIQGEGVVAADKRVAEETSRLNQAHQAERNKLQGDLDAALAERSNLQGELDALRIEIKKEQSRSLRAEQDLENKKKELQTAAAEKAAAQKTANEQIAAAAAAQAAKDAAAAAAQKEAIVAAQKTANEQIAAATAAAEKEKAAAAAAAKAAATAEVAAAKAAAEEEKAAAERNLDDRILYNLELLKGFRNIDQREMKDRNKLNNPNKLKKLEYIVKQVWEHLRSKKGQPEGRPKSEYAKQHEAALAIVMKAKRERGDETPFNVDQEGGKRSTRRTRNVKQKKNTTKKR
jgi:hypothetical protein